MQESFEHEGFHFVLKVFRTEYGYGAAAYTDADFRATAYFGVDVAPEVEMGFFRRFGENFAPQILEDVKNEIRQGRFRTSI